MIHFNQVSKQFNQHLIFSDVTLFFPKASYTTLYGSQFSGKTTLLRMIAAYEKPDSGSLTVADLDVGSMPQDRIPFLRRQIGFLESSPIMLEDLTVVENLGVTLQIAGLSRRDIAHRISESLLELGLEALGDVRAEALNYEQRRLVACVRATIHRPAIVLADETALDTNSDTATIVDSILEKANGLGATIVTAGYNDPTRRPPSGSGSVFIKEGSCSTNEFNERIP